MQALHLVREDEVRPPTDTEPVVDGGFFEEPFERTLPIIAMTRDGHVVVLNTEHDGFMVGVPDDFARRTGYRGGTWTQVHLLDRRFWLATDVSRPDGIPAVIREVRFDCLESVVRQHQFSPRGRLLAVAGQQALKDVGYRFDDNELRFDL